MTDLKYKIMKEQKSKGFSRKEISVVGANKKMVTLAEIKKICKTLDKEAQKNGSSYFIRGRNELRNTTIRNSSGQFYDEIADYYNNKGYDEDKFDKYYRIEIVTTTPNKK